jgi:hypothetical protein
VCGGGGGRERVGVVRKKGKEERGDADESVVQVECARREERCERKQSKVGGLDDLLLGCRRRRLSDMPLLTCVCGADTRTHGT